MKTDTPADFSSTASEQESLNRRLFLKTATAAASGAAVWTALPTLTANAAPEPPASAPKKKYEEAEVAVTPEGPVPLAPPDKQPADLKVPKPVAKKAGWAVVGLGELALGEILPAFRTCQTSELKALVSGHPAKAKQVAEAYDVNPKNIYDYTNFDTLADNAEVDIIYIVLPNSMHEEFTIRALKAGKHVLCEKPMAASVEEAERMIAAAKTAGKKLSIAYRLHHEPVNRMAMEIAKSEKLGKVKTFTASNCQNVKAPNIRLSSKLAGGPVGDVGIYCINAARYVINEEPVEAAAFACQPKDDPRFKEVPESVAFTLRYPSGALAHCECSFGTVTSRFFRVHCEKGYIELDPAFAYAGIKMKVKREKGDAGGPEVANLEIEEIDQFAAQIDDFSMCVLENKETRTPGELGLADMKIITAINSSLKGNGTAAKV